METATTTEYGPVIIGITVVFIALFVLWNVFWKGIALWRAARLSDKWWFIAFLFIHTVGLLEIIYIFIVARKKERARAAARAARIAKTPSR